MNAQENKLRALRNTIAAQDDLLARALPYVEAALDGDEYDAAGKAKARELARQIRDMIFEPQPESRNE